MALHFPEHVFADRSRTSFRFRRRTIVGNHGVVPSLTFVVPAWQENRIGSVRSESTRLPILLVERFVADENLESRVETRFIGKAKRKQQQTSVEASSR